MVADVIIVLYVSSFSGDTVTQLFTENFIQDLSSRLNIGAGDDDTRVAVVIANETSSMVSLDFNDGSSTTNLLWRLDDLFDESHDAFPFSPFELIINQMLSHSNTGNRPEVRDFLVILTDDLPLNFLDNFFLNRIKREAEVLAVGLTPEVSENKLIDLSSQPNAINETYFYVTDISDADTSVQQIVDVMCSEYTTGT